MLFDLICEGQIIVGFVDYKWSDKRISRDVCKIIRHEENRISIGSRGMGYGSVDPWEIDVGCDSEKDYFVSVCKAINLEWIIPFQN